MFTAKRNLSVKGEWTIHFCGQLFCHLMDTDMWVFEKLCKAAGTPFTIQD
jgi:hypothetical protein